MKKRSVLIAVLGMLCLGLFFMSKNGLMKTSDNMGTVVFASEKSYAYKYTEDFSTNTFIDKANIIPDDSLTWDTGAKRLILPWDPNKAKTQGVATSTNINTFQQIQLMPGATVNEAKIVDLSSLADHKDCYFSYSLSNDGGKTWVLAQSGQDITFATSGSDLRWKAYIMNTHLDSPSSPAITGLVVYYNIVSPSLPVTSLSAKIIPGAVTEVEKGATDVQLAQILLTNTGTEDLSLSQVSIKGSLGSFDKINVSNLYLYAGDIKIGAPSSIEWKTNGALANFNLLNFKIPKGGRLTLTMKGDIPLTNIKTSIAYGLEWTTTNIIAKGVFSGNKAIVDIYSQPWSVIAIKRPVGPISLNVEMFKTAVTQIAKGATNVLLVASKLSNTSSEDITVSEINISGVYSAINEMNTTLYINGTKIGAPNVITDNMASYNKLSLQIPKGQDTILVLRGDIPATNIKTPLVYYFTGFMTAYGSSGNKAHIEATGSSSVLYVNSSLTPESELTSGWKSRIPEGALIRAKGDIDVYIVKYVGDKRFKRIILSPSVFRSYGHLKWENVIDVDKTILDLFTTSNYVYTAGDSKIWKLEPLGDTGKKQKILDLDYDPDSVYEINTVDKDSYK